MSYVLCAAPGHHSLRQPIDTPRFLEGAKRAQDMVKDISVPFSYTKDGIYYFERRVPRDLRKHYSAAKIAYSLRTRSASLAASRAARAAQQLDEYCEVVPPFRTVSQLF